MPEFFLPVRVYYEDTDAGGVVYHANYLKFAERSRSEWLRHLGFEQRNVWEDHGIGFVVRSCQIEYLAPARLDDRLDVSCEVVALTKTRIEMMQKVHRDGVMLCHIKVVLVCVDRGLKPARIPETMALSLD